MTTLLLVRHGNNDAIGKILPGQLPGIHLNDAGRDQALLSTENLHQLPICAIYSSPLERAVETAQPLAHDLDLQVNIRSDWVEMDSGSWTGLSIDHLNTLPEWKIFRRNPIRHGFPGGESFPSAIKRIRNGLNEIYTRHNTRDLVVIFSHADIIKLTVCLTIGIGLSRFPRLIVDTASLTVLRIKRSQPQLIHLNMRLPYSISSLLELTGA